MVHGGAIPLGAPAHADLVALGRSFWLDGDGAWTWGRPPEPPAEDAPEAADLPPGPWTSVVHPTHWTALEDALRRVRGTLCPTSALIRLSDGELVRCYLGLGQGGRVLGQLFPAEREEEEAEQYRLAVEAAPTGLLMVDTSGTITLVNRQIEAMFGYDRSELQGQPLDVLLPQSVRGHHTKLMAAFMAEPTSRPMGRNRDLFGVRRDGGEFAIEIGLSPAAVGTRQQVLASVVDVSQRKRQELELRERVEDLQRNRAQMDMLSEMSSLLQHAVTREEAHEIVAAFGRRLLAPIFPDVSVAIYTSRASADALELRQAWGPHAMQERFVPDDCWALRRSLPHWPVSADGSHDLPHCRHTCEAGWHLCLPISAHNQLVGQMTLHGHQELDQHLRENLERIAKAIADQLALTKSNIGLRESLQFLATRDPLTGLFNRRHLDDSIDREFSRSKRNNSPVAAWMVDIDHFKAFNDTHGHPAADRVLAEFGRLLRTSCRDMDLACRFGGEEFVVILLPDCTREDAARRAEAFREKVANTALEITVSVGVAEFPGDGHSWEMVLRRADDALYQAKRTGRNRVVLASREQEGA